MDQLPHLVLMLCLVRFLQPFSELRDLSLLPLDAFIRATDSFLKLLLTLVQALLQLLLNSLLLLSLTAFLCQLRLQGSFGALLSTALAEQRFTVLQLDFQSLQLFAHLGGVSLKGGQPLRRRQPLLLQLLLGFSTLTPCSSTDGTQ